MALPAAALWAEVALSRSQQTILRLSKGLV
mgnify:CR=1 FL=1